MRRLVFLSLLSAVLASTTQAEVTASPSRYDHRTRTVNYEPMEVYQIKGFYGYFVRLEFAPDETEIEFALGDEAAWQVRAARNNLLLKPSQKNPDTNMVVITNKRTYNFVLTAEEVPATGTEKSMAKASDQQFLIRFAYPREAAAQKAQQRKAEEKAYAEKQRKEREEMEKKLREYQVGAALRDANNTVLNTDYFGCGAENVENDWIVIQRTAKEMVLRNGKFVGCLINANRATTRTDSGTVSPQVQRKLSRSK